MGGPTGAPPSGRGAGNHAHAAGRAWPAMFARPDGARRSNPAERTATSPKLPPPQAASFNGGTRPLGIPTVGDRVAQTVVKMVLEPMVEPSFHPDSYGYRPGRSAIDAVARRGSDAGAPTGSSAAPFL